MSIRTLAGALSLSVISVALAADPGVTPDSILLGQSAALKGPAQALGQGMQIGLEAAFAEANARGGVNGRTIELKTINDGYEPDKCTKATTMLVEKAGVFAMIGGVGTPTAKVAVPICEENGVPFIAPFTGARFLRDTDALDQVHNMRASYDQEMEALASHLVDGSGFKRIALFYQNDGYGKAGLNGIVDALTARGMELCGTGTYERNTVAIAPAVSSIAASNPDAVIMVGAYAACAAFIKSAKSNDVLADATFCNISFVGTRALGSALGADSDGVIVSQVVPYPWDTSIPVVKEFHAAMNASGNADDIGFISFEGYLAGRLFCEVLSRIDGEPTRAAFNESFAALSSHDFGGFPVGYGADDNQGCDEVFLTVFENGKAVPLATSAIASADD